MQFNEARGLRRYLGLMFRTSRTNPLMFSFEKPISQTIHSYFVFFSFYAIWTLEDGTKEIALVKPFSKNIKPSKPYIRLIEIPKYQIKEVNTNGTEDN